MDPYNVNCFLCLTWIAGFAVVAALFFASLCNSDDYWGRLARAYEDRMKTKNDARRLRIDLERERALSKIRIEEAAKMWEMHSTYED